MESIGQREHKLCVVHKKLCVEKYTSCVFGRLFVEPALAPGGSRGSIWGLSLTPEMNI